MHFWDTSALLKLYVPEADSATFLAFVGGSRDVIVASELAQAELYRALWFKEFSGALRRGGAASLFAKARSDMVSGKIVLLPFGREVQDEFRAVADACFRLKPAVPIRTMDGLHLATARVARARLVVCADTQFRKAALALGMPVFPPP